MSTATRRRALTVEMTSGSLWKNILLFSLPLMMTQVLEVLFNLSDVAIAGKYAYNTYVALGSVGSTTTLVTLVGYSTMAGLIGGGGLGRLAYNYGYQRFQPDVMIFLVVLIIVIVQIIQFAGERISKAVDHR